MRRRLPPLIQLRAFEAVARHSSFKDAATELAVTATAVSHQIRMLEEFCGQALFRRRPRPVQLTEAGRRLFPVMRRGFDEFEAALNEVSTRAEQQTLAVTTTNAFASRWLVPRLPEWRTRHAEVVLNVIGTDALMDLAAGDADVAIRYMFEAATHDTCIELLRDRFFPVCSPALLPAGQPLSSPDELRGATLIHCHWQPTPHAPTWQRWLATVSPTAPALSEMTHLRFHEELHSIDAAIAGQGIAIVSDLLVAEELATGRLAKAFDFALPGWGFYLVYEPKHPRQPLIEAFSAWMRSAREGRQI